MVTVVMVRLYLLFFFVCVSQASILCKDWSPDWSRLQGPAWNGLRVGWGPTLQTPGAFDRLPRTETAARNEGFTMLSDCGEIPNFAGKRYVKNGDTAVVLLYDVQGYIAGIQAGFANNQPNDYPNNLQYNPFVLYDDKQFITAYFVDPSTICNPGRTAVKFMQDGTGTDLYIQNGTTPSSVITIPHKEKDLGATKWTKGKCFTMMGMHYWYNVRKDMSCDEVFPAFSMYHDGWLKAFGWVFDANLTSTRYGHATTEIAGAFFQTVPDCLSLLGTQSTQHIYLTDDPQKIQC